MKTKGLEIMHKEKPIIYKMSWEEKHIPCILHILFIRICTTI